MIQPRHRAGGGDARHAHRAARGFKRVELVQLEEVAELPPSERGGGGFGRCPRVGCVPLDAPPYDRRRRVNLTCSRPPPATISWVAPARARRLGDPAPLGHLRTSAGVDANTILRRGRGAQPARHRRPSTVVRRHRGRIMTRQAPNPSPTPLARRPAPATSSSCTSSTAEHELRERVPRVTTTGSVPRLIIGIINSRDSRNRCGGCIWKSEAVLQREPRPGPRALGFVAVGIASASPVRTAGASSGERVKSASALCTSYPAEPAVGRVGNGSPRGAVAGAPVPPAPASRAGPGIARHHRVEHQRRRLLLDQ